MPCIWPTFFGRNRFWPTRCMIFIEQMMSVKNVSVKNTIYLADFLWPKYFWPTSFVLYKSCNQKIGEHSSCVTPCVFHVKKISSCVFHVKKSSLKNWIRPIKIRPKYQAPYLYTANSNTNIENNWYLHPYWKSIQFNFHRVI